MGQRRKNEEKEEGMVKRIEEVMTKYIRFMEMEQWVEERIKRSDKIREEENIRRERGQ